MPVSPQPIDRKSDVDESFVMAGANRPWEVQAAPIPKAEPGLVFVKMHASGMCYTDVWVTQG